MYIKIRIARRPYIRPIMCCGPHCLTSVCQGGGGYRQTSRRVHSVQLQSFDGVWHCWETFSTGALERVRQGTGQYIVTKIHNGHKRVKKHVSDPLYSSSGYNVFVCRRAGEKECLEWAQYFARA